VISAKGEESIEIQVPKSGGVGISQPATERGGIRTFSHMRNPLSVCKNITNTGFLRSDISVFDLTDQNLREVPSSQHQTLAVCRGNDIDGIIGNDLHGLPNSNISPGNNQMCVHELHLTWEGTSVKEKKSEIGSSLSSGLSHSSQSVDDSCTETTISSRSEADTLCDSNSVEIPAIVDAQQKKVGCSKKHRATSHPKLHYPVRLTRSIAKRMKAFEEEAMVPSLNGTLSDDLLSRSSETLHEEECRKKPQSSDDHSSFSTEQLDALSDTVGMEEESVSGINTGSFQPESTDLMCDLFRPLPLATEPQQCSSSEARRTFVSAVLHGIKSTKYSLVEDEDDIFMK
jgi:hypothetical protein